MSSKDRARVAFQFDPQFAADGDGKAVDFQVVLDPDRLDERGVAVELLHQPSAMGERTALWSQQKSTD